MAVHYGYWYNPLNTLFAMTGAAGLGKVPRTTEMAKMSGTSTAYRYASSTAGWTMFSICATLGTESLGPGMLFIAGVDPASDTRTTYNTRVYIDGVLIHSWLSMSASGNNYLVGMPFDNQTATRDVMFFKHGFRLEGYKNTTINYNGFITFSYCTFDYVDAW